MYPESSSFRDGADMLYPMYVMEVPRFLEMCEARPHEELLAEGALVPFASEPPMFTTFVSHQWAGRHHPDRHFSQSRVLQRVLIRAASGDVDICTDLLGAVVYRTRPSLTREDLVPMASGYLWFDYFSVPQPEASQAVTSDHTDLHAALGRAVASLDSYIDKCQIFMVLAPSIVHEDGHMVDYVSWKARGWCRFERLSRLLTSADQKTLLVVRHEDTIFEVGAYEYLLNPVGTGAFAVESDRDRLAPKVMRMMTNKLESLLCAGRLEEYRVLMAHRSILLDGLPVAWDDIVGTRSQCVRLRGAAPLTDEPDAANFLADMGLRSPTDGVDGTCPLAMATILGDIKVMRGLIRLRADVNSRDTRRHPERLSNRGRAPMHAAAMYGHIAAVEVLLAHGADVNVSAVWGGTPITSACRDCPEVVRKLVESRADLERRLRWGCSGLDMRLALTSFESARALLDAGHGVQPGRDGLGPLHFAGLFGCPEELVEALVDAGASLLARFSPVVGSITWSALTTWSLHHRFGCRSFNSKCGYHVWGMTPLMAAAMCGSTMVARVMLDRRADPKDRSRRGLTALQLASIFRPHMGDDEMLVYADSGIVSAPYSAPVAGDSLSRTC